jgi:hypothetical protein
MRMCASALVHILLEVIDSGTAILLDLLALECKIREGKHE